MNNTQHYFSVWKRPSAEDVMKLTCIIPPKIIKTRIHIPKIEKAIILLSKIHETIIEIQNEGKAFKKFSEHMMNEEVNFMKYEIIVHWKMEARQVRMECINLTFSSN